MEFSNEHFSRVPFPGNITRFKKDLLILVVNDIQNQISNVNVRWFKCKPPWTVYNKPSEYHPSDINDANMVIIEKNSRFFFQSFPYRSKGGAIHIYEQNIEPNEISIIEKILKKHGFPSIHKEEEIIEFTNKKVSPLMLIWLIAHLSLIPLLFVFTRTFGWTTGLIIVLCIFIVLLISAIWSLKKIRKI